MLEAGLCGLKDISIGHAKWIRFHSMMVTRIEREPNVEGYAMPVTFYEEWALRST